MQSRDAGLPDPASPPQGPPRRHAPLPASAVAGRIGGAPLTAVARNLVPSRPPGLAATPDAGALIKALRRRWLSALGLGILVAGVVASAAWMLLAPKYAAFAQVKVDAWQDKILDGKEGATGDRTSFLTYLKAQTTQLKSRIVINAALNREEVKKLNLAHKYPAPELWLEQELKVETQPDSEYITLTLPSDDPEEARVVLNAITEAYRKEVIDRENSRRTEDVNRLRKVYNGANQTLQSKREELKRMVKELDGTLESEARKFEHNALLQRLADARRYHSQVSFELTKARGHYKVAQAREASQAETPVSESAINEAVESDPFLKGQLDRIKAIEGLMTEIRANTGNFEGEPKYRLAKRKLPRIKAEVAKRRKKLKKDLQASARERARSENKGRMVALQTEIAALEPQEASYSLQVQRLEAKAKKIGDTTVAYEALKADIVSSGALVDECRRRLQVSEFEQEARQRIAIVQEAALMGRDIKKQVLGTVFGAGVALAAGCLVVAWWEFRRRRVRSPDEVSTGLGIRVVGAVPAAADIESIINAPPEEELEGHQVLESIDSIRTLVLHSGQEDAMRVLMVTSAEGGEGKTTLACHLAGSLSRAGRKTLLIDGDLRQPAVHQFFEAPVQPGFSEVLLGEVDTVDAILPTNQDGLMVMAAGQWDREVIQSLARGGAAGIIEKLKEEFDFIVIDSHPVLTATDSLLIGETVDGVILSVLRDVSQTPRVYAASERLQSLGIRVLGAVINASNPEEVYVAGLAYAAAA